MYHRYLSGYNAIKVNSRITPLTTTKIRTKLV